MTWNDTKLESKQPKWPPPVQEAKHWDDRSRLPADRQSELCKLHKAVTRLDNGGVRKKHTTTQSAIHHRISGYFAASSSRSNLSHHYLLQTSIPASVDAPIFRAKCKAGVTSTWKEKGPSSRSPWSVWNKLDPWILIVMRSHRLEQSYLRVLIYFGNFLCWLGTGIALRPRPFTPSFQGSLHLQRTTGAASPANHLGSPKTRNLKQKSIWLLKLSRPWLLDWSISTDWWVTDRIPS